MKKTKIEIIMNDIMNCMQELKYSDDVKIGDIDLRLKLYYDDECIKIFHENNGYIKVSNMLSE
jgi:hypothetical protein